MFILDANMILRYLLNDNEEMANRAEMYIQRDDAHVTIEVMVEVVYVLSRVYKVGRRELADILLAFLDSIKSRDMNIIKVAVTTYGRENLDFVDCVLYAYAKVDHITVATFDKKLNRLIDSI